MLSSAIRSSMLPMCSLLKVLDRCDGALTAAAAAADDDDNTVLVCRVVAAVDGVLFCWCTGRQIH